MIVEDTFLECVNSSLFSNSVECEQPIAQCHSLIDTQLFTPTQRSQGLTNSSQVNLTHPHIGFTPKVPTSINISSSPLDTYSTNEDFDDHLQSINQKFHNIYRIMEATSVVEALMADLGFVSTTNHAFFFDIDTPFLHGDLNEEIFMQQLPFFEDSC